VGDTALIAQECERPRGSGQCGAARPSVPVGMRQARLSSVLEIDVTGEALHEHRDWVAGRFARQVLAGLRSTLR